MPKTRNDSQAEPKLPMTDAQLEAWEAGRDLEAELLESVRQFQRGEGRVVYPGVVRDSKLSCYFDDSEDAQKETPAPVTVTKGGRGSSGA